MDAVEIPDFKSMCECDRERRRDTCPTLQSKIIIDSVLSPKPDTHLGLFSLQLNYYMTLAMTNYCCVLHLV